MVKKNFHQTKAKAPPLSPTLSVLLPVDSQYSHFVYLSKNAHIHVGINLASWFQVAEINPLENLRI